MSLSTREKILETLVNIITAEPTLEGRVYRSRVVAMARNDSPAVLIRPENETVEYPDALGPVTRKMVVIVDYYIRDRDLDKAANAVIAAVQPRIMADTSLGMLAQDIQEQTSDWTLTDADIPLCVVAVKYLVIYRTPLTAI